METRTDKITKIQRYSEAFLAYWGTNIKLIAFIIKVWKHAEQFQLLRMYVKLPKLYRGTRTSLNLDSRTSQIFKSTW